MDKPYESRMYEEQREFFYNKKARSKHHNQQSLDLSKPGIIYSGNIICRIVMVWGSMRYLLEGLTSRGCPHQIYLPPIFYRRTWNARQMVFQSLKRAYPTAEIRPSVYPMDVHVVYAWDGHTPSFDGDGV
jgi:hypothetical protein